MLVKYIEDKLDDLTPLKVYIVIDIIQENGQNYYLIMNDNKIIESYHILLFQVVNKL